MNTRQIRSGFLKKCSLVIKISFCIFVLGVLLCSCSANKIYDSTGMKIDNEVFSSIRKDIEDMRDPAQAEEGDVFWTPTGMLWHLYSDCSFISESKTVLHGTPDEAKVAGKEKECSRCAEREALEKLSQKELQEGDVFWTWSGSVWHINRDCRHIASSANVFFGSVEDAKNAGKSDVCSSCKKE